MCRTTAAPLMAMAGMAGTAVGVAIAVIREKADRRSIRREAEEEEAAAREAEARLGDGEEPTSGESQPADRTDEGQGLAGPSSNGR